MPITLRNIAHAVWATQNIATYTQEAVYERARILQKKRIIRSTDSSFNGDYEAVDSFHRITGLHLDHETRRGVTTTYTEADAAFAALVLLASLNGTSWTVLEVMDLQLRASRVFEQHMTFIRAGVPLFVRADIGLGGVDVRIGGVELPAADMRPGVTQTLLWPVSALASPVLSFLAK